ncbi:ATP-binding cassette domain-containing protein [Staphylococcus americanisciuri]|uniref:ATP-binding cassette domain-containing protein n=1 Tax=Staphylococcus americanisciuri TaxID=2973940 RepID=A0ABT2F1H9_9STAP|nr:ATP-binding cassette domain-containing protein [Staphylococcus americanisciuri]MCS4486289.1 ATP-binding cassette domain-containing protein [Staphylococcus americanisciuri]
MTNILEITNLTIENNMREPLVQNVTLGLHSSKVNVLIGESGSGKSLTAKALVGHVPKTLAVHYDSLNYKNQSIENMHTLLGKDIGFISQDYTHSFNDHTKLGQQLIDIYRIHYNVNKNVAQKFVKAALCDVNLNPEFILKQYRFNLSGGQLARVQLASVMMLEPNLIIADEPTASLDVITGYQVMHLIKRLADVHRVTLLVITHNLSHVLDFSDWIYVIQKGKIVDSNHVQAFKNQTVTPYSLTLFNAGHRL